MRMAAYFAVLLAVSTAAFACETPVSVCPRAAPGSFPLIQSGAPAAIYIDADANPAVQHVAGSFAEDLERVSGHQALRLKSLKTNSPVVIIGVLGHSKVIDGLVRAKKIDAADISGQWEAFRQIVVANPVKGIKQALVIVGADRRGAVFGAYDLSEKIGVSPAYWFADVPVRHAGNLYLTAGSRRDQPKVRYRGFFINDEAPAFSTWTKEKFGGANHKAYAHIFEYLLRMKGNYLWPAMWAPRAFNADDPENMVLADAMGVVMGTSHHEPMTRAQDEWHRNTEQGVTGGKWDYTTNTEKLRKFWRGGIERMMSKGDGTPYESLVTVGMRGDGDEPMAEGTATKLLETIVEIYKMMELPRGVMIDLKIHLPPDAAVMGRDERLGQVIRNLVDNAVSFSPKDGTVTILARADSGHAVITVDDQGPGIPSDNLETIFQRFYTERPQEHDFGKNSGLGLSIARQITEGVGGRIWAENRPDGGARFVVELPLAVSWQH